MNIIDVIHKKRLSKELSKEEISYAINGFINGSIENYQMSALLMAICINDMTDREVIDLTDIMLNSGEVMDLSSIDGIKIDKHSTGGIGDKTTLVLAPLVASLDVIVPKMSGRGLGLTGGTIDKLESIHNFNVLLNTKTFIDQINTIKVAIASQTGNLVPADKKIYALRDVTGTAESVPLIASSIMSKKIASGADKFIIDIKVGEGALLSNIEETRRLAHLMIKIGRQYNKQVICILSNMDQPLGYAVGNGLEVLEAIDTLSGKGPSDLNELVITLASYMVASSKNIKVEEASEMVKKALYSGMGLNKFKELVYFQGGDITQIACSKKTLELTSKISGYVNKVSAYKVGKFVHDLGAGRIKEGDFIDYKTGVILHKKIGDYVMKGESLATIYYTNEIDTKLLLEAFTIEVEKTNRNPLIYEVIE